MHRISYMVAFLGVGRGTGNTHMAIMAAVYYANVCNLKTALVELNSHNDYIEILKGVDVEVRHQDHFNYARFDFYPNGSDSLLDRLYMDGYNVIVLDMAYDEKAVSKLIRADIKIVVVSLELWKINNFIIFLKENSRLVKELDNILTLSVNRYAEKELEREYSVRLNHIPYEGNPFQISGHNLLWIKQVLNAIEKNNN